MKRLSFWVQRLSAVAFCSFFILSAPSEKSAWSHDIPSEKEEYLTAVTIQVNEAVEELSYKFSKLALKRFCRTEYQKMKQYVYERFRGDFHANLTTIRNHEKGWMYKLLEDCRYKDELFALETRFKTFVPERFGDLLNQVEGLLDNENTGYSFEQRKEQAQLVVNTVLQQDFQAKKVLELLLSQDSERSEINLKYLQKTEHLEEWDSETLAELNRMAQIENQKAQVEAAKKGVCTVCNKKLGMRILECDYCHQEVCFKHLHTSEHPCKSKSEFEALGQEELRGTLKPVVAEKVKDKI